MASRLNTDTAAVTDEAVERSYGAVDDVWRSKAADAIEFIAHRQFEFTTDDVWGTGLEMPDEGRALGGAMRRAVRDGIITKTDRFRNSSDPIRHSRPMTVWESRMQDTDVT